MYARYLDIFLINPFTNEGHILIICSMVEKLESNIRDLRKNNLNVSYAS